MKRTGRKQEWSLTMFAFGTVVFFPPIISLFDKPVLILGLPLTFLVSFAVWAILILSIWLGARPSRLWGGLVTSGPEELREPTLEQVDIAHGLDINGPDVLTPSLNDPGLQPPPQNKGLSDGR